MRSATAVVRDSQSRPIYFLLCLGGNFLSPGKVFSRRTESFYLFILCVGVPRLGVTSPRRRCCCSRVLLNFFPPLLFPFPTQMPLVEGLSAAKSRPPSTPARSCAVRRRDALPSPPSVCVCLCTDRVWKRSVARAPRNESVHSALCYEGLLGSVLRAAAAWRPTPPRRGRQPR